MPPRRSMPSARPNDSNPPSGRRRRTAASNVPPPRSYTATARPGARRSACAYQVAAATGSAQQAGGGQVHEAQRLAQHVPLELAPVRGVGHGHCGGRTTLGLGDRGGDPAQDLGQAPVDRHRRATEQERGRVADAPLELAGHPVGLLRGPPLGGVADQELAVVAEEHDRRHRRGPVPERGHLGAPAAGDAGGRVGGAEVDAQRVGHVRYCGSPRCPAKGRDRSASVGGR